MHFVIDQCGQRSGVARIALQRLSQITDRARIVFLHACNLRELGKCLGILVRCLERQWKSLEVPGSGELVVRVGIEPTTN